MKWTERYSRVLGTGLAFTETGCLALHIVETKDLLQYKSPIGWVLLAASICGGTTFILVLFSTIRHFYYKSQHREDKRNWMLQNTPNLAALVFLVWLIVSLAATIALNITRNKLPDGFLNDTTRSYIFASAIVWIGAAILLFLWSRSVKPLSDEAVRIQKERKARRADEEAQAQGESTECAQALPQQTPDSLSTVLSVAPEETTESRSGGSGSINSIRRSLSNAVRPITSKTRLVGQSTPHQRPSHDSTGHEREDIDEGFDSWDTSAVEPQSWQSYLSPSGVGAPSSVKNQQTIMLETIPASPTASRSPSPGNPLDLPCPVDVNSHARPLLRQSTSSTTPTGRETHIHPLFRSDSPTPTPTAPFNSTITAAPNAGQAIPEASVRRNRSASTPDSSLLILSITTFDFADRSSRRGGSAEVNTERDGDTSDTEVDSKKTSSTEDRVMTPPIPEWVLGAGQRHERESYGKKTKKRRIHAEDGG